MSEDDLNEVWIVHHEQTKQIFGVHGEEENATAMVEGQAPGDGWMVTYFPLVTTMDVMTMLDAFYTGYEEAEVPEEDDGLRVQEA